MIKCKICGKKYKRITASHLKIHNMTSKEYKDKYGKMTSDEMCIAIGNSNRGKIRTNRTKDKLKKAHWTKRDDADQIQQKIKDGLKGRKSWNKGTKGLMPEPWNKGKKYKLEEILGEEKAKKVKEQRSSSLKKHYEENVHHLKGKKQPLELVEKRKKSFKKRYDNGYVNPMKGKHQTEAAKRKISINSARIWLGKKLPIETRKKQSDARKKGLKNGTIKLVHHIMRDNGPYIWENTHFDSNEEMKCAEIILDKPIEGVNCHIKMGRFEIDFYLEDINLFIEYHPWDFYKNRTTEEYTEQRKQIIKEKYPYTDLITITSLKEAEKINWIKEEC